MPGCGSSPGAAEAGAFVSLGRQCHCCQDGRCLFRREALKKVLRLQQGICCQHCSFGFTVSARCGGRRSITLWLCQEGLQVQDLLQKKQHHD